ncbi:MAG: hypothetical protein LBU34_01780 [Planctomycetaceae bacterium]|nr:hypothetical protein [Planctomycetaceae bacterium]
MCITGCASLHLRLCTSRPLRDFKATLRRRLLADRQLKQPTLYKFTVG